MKRRNLVLTGTCVWVFVACGVLSAGELANVNGTSITAEDLEKLTSTLSPNERARYQDPEAKAELLDRLINREVLFQESKRTGLDKEKETVERMEEAQRQVLIGVLADKIAREKFTDEEMRSYYEKNKNDFTEVRASHILVKEEKEAKDLKKKLEVGVDFGDMASKHSIDPATRHGGGDLGYFTRRTAMKPIADTVFALKINEVGGPVKTSFGYHLLKVTEIRAPKKYEEISEGIKQALRSAVMNDEIERLKSQATVKVYKERLKEEAKKEDSPQEKKTKK